MEQDEESTSVNSKYEALNADIDYRIFHLWVEAQDVDEWTVEVIAAFLRAAYGRGYVDALEEERRGERGKLCYDNEFRIP